MVGWRGDNKPCYYLGFAAVGASVVGLEVVRVVKGLLGVEEGVDNKGKGGFNVHRRTDIQRGSMAFSNY